MLIFAPFAAMLIQLAVSRSREYEADATGAKTTGNPYALASALEKIDAYSKRVPHGGIAFERASVHRAAMVGGGMFTNLFSTHPPMQSALSALLAAVCQWTLIIFHQP